MVGATTLYRSLTARHPGEAGLWALLGDTLRISGDPAAGAEALSKALALSPDDTDIAIEWALALFEAGNAAAALSVLRDRNIDDSPRGLTVQADAHRATGAFGDAGRLYLSLLKLEPVNASAQISLGVCLQEAGDLEEAMACYNVALTLAPNSAEALTNLGLAQSATGDLGAALNTLQRAAALEPGDPETQCALGATLQMAGRAGEAAACFEQAIAVAPGHARAWSNLGNARQDQQRLADARDAHDRAVALAPDDAEIHWNRAMTLLLSGDLTTGFAEYEWRTQTADHAPPTHSSPCWEGDSSAGLQLLLLAEQGFGDAIQFARYVPLLQARGADVFLQCHPKLTALFETLDGSATVLPTGEPPPPVDAHLPLMSLPHLLGITADSIPADCPYLRPPSDARAPPPGDGRPRVGLCWTGNPNHPDNPHRSLAFEGLTSVLARGDIDWRSLQFGPAAAEATGHLPEDPAWTACLEGFGNTAAALQSCDLVITVDTSTAHLAGALGRPVWLLLKYAPDWRWMIGRTDSPWYPTARLFRQAAPGDWTDVVARVDTALAIWMES